MNRAQRRAIKFNAGKVQKAIKEYESNPKRDRYLVNMSSVDRARGTFRTTSFSKADIETIIKEKGNN